MQGRIDVRTARRWFTVGVAAMVFPPAFAQAQPAATAAQSATIPNISLAELRSESKDNDVTVEKPRRLNVSHGISDEISRNENFRRVYSLRMAIGEAVQVDLNSTELDTILRAYDDKGDLVAQNDDWGGSTNSRLYLAALDKEHTHLFLVATTTPPHEGAIELQISERDPPRPVEPKSISIGQSVSGTLEPSSALNIEKQAVFDTYVFDGNAGDRVKLVVTPTDAPVAIELRLNQEKPFRASSNLPGRPATIFGALKGTGRYEAVVLGSPSLTSPYKLDFLPLGPTGDNARPQTISIGQVINGVFTAGSPVVPGTDRPFAIYRLEGHAGDEVIVSASPASDGAQQKLSSGIVLVEIGVDTPVGFATALHGQRGVVGATTARFDHDGAVYIRVSGLGSATGYTLRVQPQAGAAAAAIVQ